MNEYNQTAIINDAIKIQQVYTSAYKIPTNTPESDGTLSWDHTTLIIVEIKAGGKTGIGYTYANPATAFLIDSTLKEWIKGRAIMDIPAITALLQKKIRNDGECGIAMMAISAIDSALWDIKAKILGLPLCDLLGQARDDMLIYGSGGFTNYSDKTTEEQFCGWEQKGIRFLKMKIGSNPELDADRIKKVRKVIHPETKLFVDANGAYTIKQALYKARQFADYGVTWFEEPVFSDNLDGLHFIREHVHEQINIAAGEYGYNVPYFHNMLNARAVDILQADASRCGGITGFLKAAVLAEGRQIPFSSHCAPSLHLHAAVSLRSFFIAEYFFDHVRIEEMLFDGFSLPVNGRMRPDPDRPGMGIEFKYSDAEKFRILP